MSTDILDYVVMPIKSAILFTGIIFPRTFDTLMKETKCIKYKFASIWDNEDQIYHSKLIDNNFIVIINNSKDQELFTPQFVPIVNALKYIKEQHVEYVLKSRFDILSSDYSRYLELMIRGYTNKITVLCGIQTDTTYFLDLIVFGNLDTMCKLYALQEANDKRFPEKFIIENVSKKENVSKETLKEIFNFSLDACIDNTIEFFWQRITKPNSIPIVNDYCKSTIIWL